MQSRRARGDDAGTAATISFLLAAAVFTAGIVVLVQFESDPFSTARPEQAELSARAADVLGIIGGSTGYPPDWARSDAAVAAIKRPGLLLEGKSRTLDPDKFLAIALGDVVDTGRPGVVDYPDLHAGLALDGYDFHLQAEPLFRADGADDFGVRGMENYRVAYIGSYSGGKESSDSASEAEILDAFDIDFTNHHADFADDSFEVTDPTERVGDKYRDVDEYLKAQFVRRLDGVAWQEDLTDDAKLPDYRFRRLSAEEVDAAGIDAPPTGRHVLGIADASASIAYVNSMELRAHIGFIDLERLAEVDSASVVKITEIVQGRTSFGIPVDFGVVEVYRETKGWCVLNPNDLDSRTGQPSVHSRGGEAPGSGSPTEWVTREINVRETCMSSLTSEVKPGEVGILAVRWESGDAIPPENEEGDPSRGWLIDSITWEFETDRDVLLRETFSTPYYDAVVLGSRVQQSAMAPNAVKEGLRDYVLRGGHLFVMDGQQNTQWMTPLLSAGDPSTDSAFPADARHPLLRTPNVLEQETYPSGDPRTLSDPDRDLFSGLIVAAEEKTYTEYILAVSNPRAFGDGLVILSAYTVSDLGGLEARKYLANNLVYGYYNYLFMSVGAPVPERGQPVASASMTAVMDASRTDDPNFVEMQLVVHTWRS